MKNKFIIALLISALAHIGILAAFTCFRWGDDDKPFGDGGVVEVIPSPFMGEGRGGGKIGRSLPSLRQGLGQAREGKSTDPSETVADVASGSSAGSPSHGSPSGNPILTKIIAKVNRAKYYPSEARRKGIEGRPEVMFQINKDGSLAVVTLKKASGNQILDDAAIETIRRAVPLPYYDRPISLAIKYSIGD